MIAPKNLPKRYLDWNRRYKAPSGRVLINSFKGYLPALLFYRLNGAFSWQINNMTRRFEYPWAFYAAPVVPGMRVLEIGGGLSGFQFVLDRLGCKVTNVDPGLEAGGIGWPCDQASITRINRIFGTSVELLNTTIDKVRLEPESFDRVYAISVIEHMTQAESFDMMRAVYRLLKPGCFFILTVDLFLNLEPFTTRKTNEYGTNVNIKSLIETTPFILADGNPVELYGYQEFDKENIQSNLETYFWGSYPALVQCVVLQK